MNKNLVAKLLCVIFALSLAGVAVSAQNKTADKSADKKAAPAAKKETAPAAKKEAPAAKKKDDSELLDLNSCSKEQLVALPGIGEKYAEAIIKGRPYKSKDQLLSKKVVPESNYKQFSAKVIAKQK